MKFNHMATIVFLLLFLTTLTCSAFLPNPWWIRCLWCVPVLGVLAFSGILLSSLNLFTGEHFRTIVPIIGVALGLLAACYVEFSDTAALFVHAMTSSQPPLANIFAKLFGLGALGMSLSAIWFGIFGLRTRAILCRALAVAAIALGTYVVAFIPAVFQVAFPAPWQCALVAFAAEIFVLIPLRNDKDL